ncbi:MAG: hypothetical protein ABFS02_07515 [Pseudomonadota bacterium]
MDPILMLFGQLPRNVRSARSLFPPLAEMVTETPGRLKDHSQGMLYIHEASAERIDAPFYGRFPHDRSRMQGCSADRKLHCSGDLGGAIPST